MRQQGFLHWVLLWDCASVHQKTSLLEWILTAHPECHVLFIPGGYTAELQPADISIQQPLKHNIQQQAMQFFAESVCRHDAVLDLRLRTLKRLMAHWVLHACAEVQKNTSITTKACRHRHQGLRREPLASTSMAHSSIRPRWNKRNHRRKRTSSSMTTTTMTTTKAMNCFQARCKTDGAPASSR